MRWLDRKNRYWQLHAISWVYRIRTAFIERVDWRKWLEGTSIVRFWYSNVQRRHVSAHHCVRDGQDSVFRSFSTFRTQCDSHRQSKYDAIRLARHIVYAPFHKYENDRCPSQRKRLVRLAHRSFNLPFLRVGNFFNVFLDGFFHGVIRTSKRPKVFERKFRKVSPL